MVSSGNATGLGDKLGDELANSERCLQGLREIRTEISRRHERRVEFFDFGLDFGLESEETIEKKLESLTRACIWHAVALKTEFALKLLYTIDGYLSSVDAKNPISTFLLARYILELVATVSEIDFGLEECVKVDLGDWERRGRTFIALLHRARHSTSDNKIKSLLTKHGIPEESLRPIRIGKAVERLSARPGFGAALSKYHSLSNICHHNGSGHKMLTESFRMTNVVTLPNGKTLFLKEKTSAMTLSYPATTFSSISLTQTARVAWWSAHCADRMIRDLRESPFTDRELRTLTDGRLARARPVDASTGPSSGMAWHGKTKKIRRNDPCSCGSGKKFKVCCGKIEVE